MNASIALEGKEKTVRASCREPGPLILPEFARVRCQWYPAKCDANRPCADYSSAADLVRPIAMSNSPIAGTIMAAVVNPYVAAVTRKTLIE